MWKKQSTLEKQNIKRIIEISTTALITDFVYNHNGNKVAIADSEGNVYLFQRHGDTFQKIQQFKANDAAIWKLSWIDPIFGQIIAIASFKKKVAVFQNKNNKWVQIARHQQHEGSVNHVEWAPAAYGIKLFSAGSDGTVCILEVKKNNWQISSFKAHESSINSLAVKGIALNEQNRGLQNIYPTIATISKDLQLKVWRHTTQARLLNLPTLSEYSEYRYYEIGNIKPHKQFTRVILFQPYWYEDSVSPCYSIISGSEDGSVKLSLFRKDKCQEQKVVHKGETPVVKVSQSLTGKHLSVSVSSHHEENNFIYSQKNNGEWVCNLLE